MKKPNQYNRCYGRNSNTGNHKIQARNLIVSSKPVKEADAYGTIFSFGQKSSVLSLSAVASLQLKHVSQNLAKLANAAENTNNWALMNLTGTVYFVRAAF
jgi:hypothetical protein